MKGKILLMAASALVLATMPAMAEDGGKGKHHGKMFEKHDTNGDGVVSKDEFLSHAEERFGKMDADGDGNFTKEEAEAVRAEMKEKWKERKDKRMERRGDGGPPPPPPEDHPSDE